MPHLRPLVDSLLAQTYSNLEFVFSDGGSTDLSHDFLDSLTDCRIRIIEQPPGTSAAENWTAASQAAQGEFTKLICQDDVLYPWAIEQQVTDLLSQPNAIMATASRDIVDAHGRTIFRNRGLSGIKGRLIDGNQAIRQCYLQGTNVIGEPLAVLFRTNTLKEALPWQDENPLMLDLSMYEKIAPRGAICIHREPIGAFRVSSSSWSTNLARQQVDQTRQSQEAYAATHAHDLSANDRRRAALGRTVQTSLRRLAYTLLRARGRLRPPE
jgi:glycosyltransferase involved in cell wall biosynthesis